MLKSKKLISIILVICMILGMMPGFSALAAGSGDFMEISEESGGTNRYLTTVNSNAFNVFMYNNTFSGTFGDQHMGGIELSLHGSRIATNGDIHLLPTPEQWDATPAPTRGTKVFDTETNTITVPMTFTGSPDGTLLYDLVATPTVDGVLLKVVLKSDMPADLVGKARFNLEFVPSKYQNKSYQADGDNDGTFDTFGVFPLHPQDPLEDVERPDLPTQSWYVKDWNEDRGDAQPLPFATGYAFSFAPEDEDYHIDIQSNKGEMELFDGRNRAQNGWYVLSSLITSGKSGDTIVEWNIRPDVHEDWVRAPVVGFSQAGYSPKQEKFAVIELDKWDEDYPTTASLVQVQADGTEVVVHTGKLSATTPWQRYKYARYDFTDYDKAGLYFIQYGDQKTEIFPISKDVYDQSWQSALSGFLAVQMDHIEVREGYRIWHGATHMDDASIGPLGAQWFDGMSMPAEMPQSIKDKGYESGEHIFGLNVGGWFDAGDFDIQTSRNVEVLQDLIYAAETFDNMEDHDTLTVEWDDKTGGLVEMHRPDGIPDVLQQIAHGTKQILAQYEVLGGVGGTMEVRTLRQYTHLGDPSSDTDGYIYDPSLGENEIVERGGYVYSGKPDDRHFLLAGGGGSFTSDLLGDSSANFAGAAYLLYDVYPELAERCMNAAMEIWHREYKADGDYGSDRWGRPVTKVSKEWNTLVQLMLATEKLENTGMDYEFKDDYDHDYFKGLLSSLVDEAVTAEGMASRYNAMFIMDLMDQDYKDKVEAAVTAYADTVSYDTPYGVMWTTGSGWGGSPTIIALGQRMGIMYKFFPEVENLKTYTLRAVDYILGRHPATNASWFSGVGTKSTLQPYNSNRGDEGFIPGSILPGHITFAPDYVESMDDFSFLWFEGESIINYQSQWISAALAASMIANQEAEPVHADTQDFNNDFMMEIKKVGENDGYLETPGFNMFMYSTTFDKTFGDQHCAGIELIQSGRRIATNGDIHLLPTPEQWDATPATIRNSRVFDEATDTITVSMTLPEEQNPTTPPAPTPTPTPTPAPSSALDLTEAPDADEADTQPDAETPEVEAPEASDEPKAEATDEPKAEATDEPKAEATDEPKAEVTDEPEAEVTGEPKAEVTDEPKAEVTGEPEDEVTDEPEAEVTDEPDADAPDEPDADVSDEPDADVSDEPQTETPDPETPAALDLAADPAVNPAVDYELIAEPEAGGVKLTVKLDEPLPADLVGKAGFNLEFIPAVYIGKSFQTDIDGDGDYDSYGVFPLVPEDDMVDMDRARTGDQLWYVKDWNEARGDAQPLPFATGKKMTFAAEDDDYRIRIESDEDLMLYDGRNRAQNGWFVLRSLIPEGETELVWHISPDVDESWTREPSIGHSQAGYEPELAKVAVIELDPNYSGSNKASVQRLNADGTYTKVFEGTLGETSSWLRYDYREFDFSEVTTPGMYLIEYDGVRTDVFPIARGVYSDSWQQSLSNFLAVQMDHMAVREGYKIWHAASHMDDALQAPADTPWFDGWKMGPVVETKYDAYEPIPGLNIGGWYDAGDFDIQTSRNMGVIMDLALAHQEYGVDYDTMMVDWDGRFVEMHRPDGIPDIQQQIKQGTLQILAQLENVGFVFPVLEVPSLRQYTHLGDGSKDTDNKVYDPSLAEDEVVGLRAGKRDDRVAMADVKNTGLQLQAAATLAAASRSLRGYDDELADTCLETAIAVWNEEKDSHTSGTADWLAAVELTMAAEDNAPYKARVLEMLDTMLAPSRMGAGRNGGGWKAARLIPYMDAAYKAKVLAAVEAYVPYLDNTLTNPFGVPDTNGMWGGSTGVVDMGVRMSILHKYFPDVVDSEYTYRVMNYILGTHAYNDTSWLSGVGTNSVEIAYGSNRADRHYIAGGIVPGYVNIQPDFPEALDDFGFLWFESEYVIDTAAKWIVLANGADLFAATETSFDAAFGETASAKITNGAAEAVQGNAILAVYAADGSMAASEFLPFDVPMYGNWKENFTTDLSQYPLDQFSYKVFFWNDQQYPLCEAFEKDAGMYVPKLASLSVNGTLVEGFDKDVFVYSTLCDAASDKAPEVTAVPAGKAEVTITQAEGIPGVAKVIVSAGGYQSVYSVYFEIPPTSDSFVDGTMDDLWTVLKEDTDKYSIETGEGLRMPTQAGDIYQNSRNWNNVFVRPAGGDWEVVAKIHYPVAPSATYQQAMLLAWQDEDNFVKLDCEYGNNGIITQFGQEIGGAFSGSSVPTSAEADGSLTVYFRIAKEGDEYTGSYSKDGLNYTTVGRPITAPLSNVQIGLFATKNSNNAEIDTYCEFVTVTKANGVELKSYQQMLEDAAKAKEEASRG